MEHKTILLGPLDGLKRFRVVVKLFTIIHIVEDLIFVKGNIQLLYNIQLPDKYLARVLLGENNIIGTYERLQIFNVKLFFSLQG